MMTNTPKRGRGNPHTPRPTAGAKRKALLKQEDGGMAVRVDEQTKDRLRDLVKRARSAEGWGDEQCRMGEAEIVRRLVEVATEE
jgi:hypothetical protein